MTSTQQRKILTRISSVEHDIAELKRVRQEICVSGTASATLASGQGSRSYTHLDISKITEAIKALTTELKQLRGMLAGGQQSLWSTVLVVY